MIQYIKNYMNTGEISCKKDAIAVFKFPHYLLVYSLKEAYNNWQVSIVSE